MKIKHYNLERNNLNDNCLNGKTRLATSFHRIPDLATRTHAALANPILELGTSNTE
jgi:hypothetical protein